MMVIKMINNFNFNSLMIYFVLLILLTHSFINNEWGYFLGTITGMLIIYFILADKETKRVIINNLIFKR